MNAASKLDVVFMSVDEWISVNDNPIQRNTEMHARKARNKHLASYAETHKRVSAAVTQDGSIYKLDGHTRALLWARGELESPSQVTVDLYHVNGMHGVHELYKHFDNQSAAETAQEKLSGALSYHNVDGNHRQFMQVGGTSAVKVITPQGFSLNMYDMVGMWRSEIEEFCLSDINQSRFRSGIVAAYLATMAGRVTGRKAGLEKVQQFWGNFNADLGERVSGKDDAVNALDKYLLSTKKNGGGAGMVAEDCGRAITACESYLSGQYYKQIPKKADIRKYLCWKFES